MTTLTKHATNLWADGTLRRGAASRLLFGLVHEDARAETALLGSMQDPRRAVCITSGGETALAMATTGCQQIQAIDINRLQGHALELKTAAIRGLTAEEIEHVLTHDARGLLHKFEQYMSFEAREFWIRNLRLLVHGILTTGAVEQRVRSLATAFKFTPTGRAIANALQDGTAMPEIEGCLAHRFLQTVLQPWAIHWLYDEVFAEQAPIDLGDRIWKRIADLLHRDSAATNPWIRFVMTGTLEMHPDARLIGWRRFDLSRVAAHLDRIENLHGDVLTVLRDAPSDSIDVVSISNICEGADQSWIDALMMEIRRTLTVDGTCVTRNILDPSAAEDETLHRHLVADHAWTRSLQAIDRSPICHNVRIWRK